MRRIQRNAIAILTIGVFMAIMLMACSQTETADETKKTEVADAKEEATAEVKEAEPKPEPAAELILEPTPEPTPESIVYEGIDMESTLPGVEWIATFESIIAEPKIVIFNDETNKKLIVENGERISFEINDVFAVYIPYNQLVKESFGIPINEIKTEYEYTSKCLIIDLDKEILKKIEGTGDEVRIGFYSEESVDCWLVPVFE